MTLRIVHDPDTGCAPAGKEPDCPLLWWDHSVCRGTNQNVPHDERPAPPWCPLRAGDVVVSARKDGGT